MTKKVLETENKFLKELLKAKDELINIQQTYINELQKINIKKIYIQPYNPYPLNPIYPIYITNPIVTDNINIFSEPTTTGIIPNNNFFTN